MYLSVRHHFPLASGDEPLTELSNTAARYRFARLWH